MLADVDRIEVVSGPGATLWGANAVNGVINVITRAAGATQRGLVSVTSGSFEHNAAVRYGGALAGRSQDRAVVAGIAFGRLEISGGNVLGRWTRSLANGGELRVQSYFDQGERDDALFFKPRRDTFDVEVQHGMAFELHHVPASHPEFEALPNRAELRRSALLRATWRFSL